MTDATKGIFWGGGKGINFLLPLPQCFVEGLRRRAVWMRPQWPPVTTVGNTASVCLSALSFPTSPPPSDPTAQEVSWPTVHRKFYREVWPENIKAVLFCVRGRINGPFSTVSKAIKRAD